MPSYARSSYTATMYRRRWLYTACSVEGVGKAGETVQPGRSKAWLCVGALSNAKSMEAQHPHSPRAARRGFAGCTARKPREKKEMGTNISWFVTGAREKRSNKEERGSSKGKGTWSEAGLYRTRPHGKACGMPGHTPPTHPSTCGSTSFDV